MKRYGAQLTIQGSEIREHKAKLAEQSAKLTEQDAQIAELKRHLEEWDHKFGDLSAKLSRAREESGAITESGPSHDVEEMVTIQMLPSEHVHERDTRTNRRKVMQESKSIATVVSNDLLELEQKVDDNLRTIKRQASGVVNKVEVKKKKTASKNKISK